MRNTQPPPPKEQEIMQKRMIKVIVNVITKIKIVKCVSSTAEK